MKKINLVILIAMLVACDSDPTITTPEKELAVFEVDMKVNLFDETNPAISNTATFNSNRLFISVTEHYRENSSIHRKVFMDMKHYVGRPDFYVDYGQSVHIGDVFFKRQRIKFQDSVDYLFDYRYDSDTDVRQFPSEFNFERLYNISNINELNQGSSKRIFEFREDIGTHKRIKIENIEMNKVIEVNENLNVEMNRSINTNKNAFGFVFIPSEGEPIYMSMKVNKSANKFEIPAELLQKFKDKVGLDSFECYIWIVETGTLSNAINTTLKSTHKENVTPMLINFVQTKKVVF